MKIRLLFGKYRHFLGKIQIFKIKITIFATQLFNNFQFFNA